MLSSRIALWIIVAIAGVANAQGVDPVSAPDRTVSTYMYLSDAKGDRLLLSTRFVREDPKYDDRAFHRFLDVLSGLEKRGFRRDDKAVIDDWDKPEPTARCYVYLEDLQAGKKTKTGTATGSRVWCSDNGASEHEIYPSDNPKHVDLLFKSFDAYFARSKERLHE